MCWRNRRPSNNSLTVSSPQQYLPALRSGAKLIYLREGGALPRPAAQGARRRWTQYSSVLQIYRITAGHSWSQELWQKDTCGSGRTAWKTRCHCFLGWIGITNPSMSRSHFVIVCGLLAAAPGFRCPSPPIIAAPALTDGINPEEVIHDARGTLDDIGDNSILVNTTDSDRQALLP